METGNSNASAVGASIPEVTAEEPVSLIQPVNLQTALVESPVVGLGAAALEQNPPAAAAAAPPPQQKPVLLDVLAGRDPSQTIAAEHLRLAGGASATEILFGLDQAPPIVGPFVVPPGNSEALRHLSGPARRAMLHSLLLKQRERTRQLSQLLHAEDSEAEDEDHSNESDESDEIAAMETFRNPELRRARDELRASLRMLDLLEDLLSMQDYTISQMGTFSKG
jgi:hypothetical protein